MLAARPSTATLTNQRQIEEFASEPPAQHNAPNIFLVGERLATVRMTMAKYDLFPSRTCSMLQFQRKHASPGACAMFQAIHLDRPQLLWIQWSCKLQEPGRRPQ
eukprot:1822918-Pyramimonas_sp.AAC.1